MRRDNITILYWYNCCVSLALAMVANTVLMDRLMLKIGLDVGLFGIIKSASFLMPALCYQLALPWLHSGAHCENICRWSYLLRVALPCAIPFVALVTERPGFLAVFIMLTTGIATSLAAFANNSLLIIYRRYLPENRFNDYSAAMAVWMNGPITLAMLFWVYWLDRIQDWERGSYLIAFALLQILSVLPGVAAFRVLAGLRRPGVVPGAPAFRFRDMLAPFRRPDYRRLLGFALCRGVASGLFLSYFTVYLLVARQWRTCEVTLFTTVFGLLGLGLARQIGKLADRLGYRSILLLLSLLMFCGNLSCAFWIDTTPGVVVTLLLLWDGNSTLFNLILSIVEQSAGGKLADRRQLATDISCYNLCRMSGIFLGCLLAGPLLTAVSDGGDYNYIAFFRWGLCFTILPVLLAWRWKTTARPG